MLVGGAVRDLVADRQPVDWDVATDARPEAVVERFPGSAWHNRFGTVTVTVAGAPVEITSYRREDGYADRRRPDRVAFGAALVEDLGRRDFTINAMAWRPSDLGVGDGALVDPFGGRSDLAAGILRAVGDPDRRFSEDALRLVRAVRFASRFALRIDLTTERAIRRHAELAAGVSGERVRDELRRLLADPDAPPSAAFGLMERLGLLEVLLPELASLRGVPQGKRLPGDALDHSLRTVDLLPADDPELRLAGLLHDLGKATTLEDGHFIGHEQVGAELAGAIADRLRLPTTAAHRITRLVRHHMVAYRPDWTDAAVRRFVRRVGRDLVEDLLRLRLADEIASGSDDRAEDRAAALRGRIAAAVDGAPLETRQLAVDGHALIGALDLPPSPRIGALLDRLLEATLEDPSLNTRSSLLDLARRLAAEPSDRG